MTDQPSGRVWDRPGPNAHIYSGESRNLEIMKNNIEMLRISIDELSSSIQEMIESSTSFSDMAASLHTMNEKVDAIWHAPGMPGYEASKTSWNEKKNDD